jgi:hypothetical protein
MLKVRLKDPTMTPTFFKHHQFMKHCKIVTHHLKMESFLPTQAVYPSIPKMEVLVNNVLCMVNNNHAGFRRHGRCLQILMKP